MYDTHIDQVKDHLDMGLAIIDVVAHVEDLGKLWRHDSIAFAMELAFKEWEQAQALLSKFQEHILAQTQHLNHEPPTAWDTLSTQK
jgi:hypothetical protein